MICAASELQGNGYNQKAIKREARNVLAAMESRFRAASKSGQCSLTYHVPMIYTSIGNDNDSVMLILTTIIKELETAGYTVRVRRRANDYEYSVSWKVKMTKKERSQMLEYMVRHLDNPPAPLDPLFEEEELR